MQYPNVPPGYVPPAYGSPEYYAKEQARQSATLSLILSLVGFVVFGLGLFLAPFAIMKAREAKKTLWPGEAGRTNAEIGEVMGWIVLVLHILAIVVCVCYLIFVFVILASGDTSGSSSYTY